MKDLLSGPFLLVVVCVCIMVFLTVVCYRENRCFNVFRSKIQYCCQAAGNYVMGYLSSGCQLYYCFGQKEGIFKDNGSEFEPYEKTASHLFAAKLHKKSLLPSKGIGVAPKDIEFVCNCYGRKMRENTSFIFSFVPVNQICLWKVIDVSDQSILCEHPVMGELRVKAEQTLKVNDEIYLKQNVKKINGLYRIDYEVI